jgi:hypothetical protein
MKHLTRDVSIAFECSIALPCNTKFWEVSFIE